jgi:predicted molibdopterin-dependent oxidoreductase YjgC
MSDTMPIVPDSTFMDNVREAHENGHEVVCAYCGVGVSPDGLDMHETGCPYPDQTYPEQGR